VDFSTADPETVIDYGSPSYYGMDLPVRNSVDAYLELESDYIRDKDTAEDLRDFLLRQYKNDHLLFNLKLPLQYINLEIGDLVKFRDLFNGVTAYGIKYTIPQAPNSQAYYPLFMITSTKKNLDSVSIECMQLHHLGGDYDNGWNVLQDEEAPVIIRENPQTTYNIGDEFETFTAIATDNLDEEVPVTITFSGDMSALEAAQENGFYVFIGTFTVTYYAVDEAGNSATIVDTITVEVGLGLGYELTGDIETTTVNDDTGLNELFPLSSSSIKSITKNAYWGGDESHQSKGCHLLSCFSTTICEY
jgi:hypothetical protein